jgi:hypothetical protein
MAWPSGRARLMIARLLFEWTLTARTCASRLFATLIHFGLVGVMAIFCSHIRNESLTVSFHTAHTRGSYRPRAPAPCVRSLPTAVALMLSSRCPAACALQVSKLRGRRTSPGAARSRTRVLLRQLSDAVHSKRSHEGELPTCHCSGNRSLEEESGGARRSYNEDSDPRYTSGRRSSPSSGRRTRNWSKSPSSGRRTRNSSQSDPRSSGSSRFSACSSIAELSAVSTPDDAHHVVHPPGEKEVLEADGRAPTQPGAEEQADAKTTVVSAYGADHGPVHTAGGGDAGGGDAGGVLKEKLKEVEEVEAHPEAVTAVDEQEKGDDELSDPHELNLLFSPQQLSDLSMQRDSELERSVSMSSIGSRGSVHGHL